MKKVSNRTEIVQEINISFHPMDEACYIVVSRIEDLGAVGGLQYEGMSIRATSAYAKKVKSSTEERTRLMEEFIVLCGMDEKSE